MSFLAGDLLTAQRVNRLRPTPYTKAATGTLGAGVTTADVPGATITFDTETDGAEVQVTWFVDFDLSGATTSLHSSRVLLDGVTASDTFATYAAEVATDRGSTGSTHKYTIPLAGSHTIKIQATTPANGGVNLYSVLSLVVYEIV
jgi:hypothetical protein